MPSEESMQYPGMRALLSRLQMGGSVAGLFAFGAVVAVTSGMLGVAAILSAPTFPPGMPADEPLPHFRGRCEQCAVVTSIRVIGPLAHGIHSTGVSRTTQGMENVAIAEGARRYEVTVQMQNGSIRVFEQEGLANWRMNERLILIGGGTTGNEPKALLAIAGNAR